MDEVAVRRVTETLKRLGDDERRHVLSWLLTYYGDDGKMLSPAQPGLRRSIVLDGKFYLLVASRGDRVK